MLSCLRLPVRGRFSFGLLRIDRELEKQIATIEDRLRKCQREIWIEYNRIRGTETSVGACSGIHCDGDSRRVLSPSAVPGPMLLLGQCRPPPFQVT